MRRVTCRRGYLAQEPSFSAIQLLTISLERRGTAPWGCASARTRAGRSPRSAPRRRMGSSSCRARYQVPRFPT